MNIERNELALRERVARLSIWKGPVEPVRLSGGITNVNFFVDDRGSRFVVRVGDDIPIHQIMRFNERAASRAAFAAGISPEVVHVGAGIMVMRYIDGHACTAADIRQPERLAKIMPLIKRVHREVPLHIRGPVLAFWVFHVIRDYGHTLREGGSRHLPRLPDLIDAATELELAVGPIEMVFGHNDLLGGNVIDDGERVWLIDWDYAGFNSPLFDLANLASNNEFTPDLETWMLSTYYRTVTRRPSDAELSRHEVRVAAARGDVEHGVGNPLEARFRLCRLHRRLHGPVRHCASGV